MNGPSIRRACCKRFVVFLAAVVTACGIASSHRSVAASDDREDFFETEIRPVLVEYCYECHAAEFDDVQGGLLLDSKQGWMQGGDSGPVIEPGDPDRSLLLEAISYENRDLQMPPDGKLADEIQDRFRQWILDGAIDPRVESPSAPTADEFDLTRRRDEHWAWQPIVVPADDESSIDSFIADRLTQAGLVPAPRARPHELIRRLYFDLIGLPPTVDELTQFEQRWAEDPDAAVLETVDRLLNDPRFGEHWATGWLDVVRYAETKGHVTDQERPYAWKYRDYVIAALNDDVPYDQFVIEHLAGDLLDHASTRPGPRGETNISPTATGALYMHEMHFMAVDPVKQRWDEINAQLEVVGKAFLGLTLDCARCHDHKFDAISQRDYYALAGFFYSTEQGTARVAPRLENDAIDWEAVQQAESQYESYLSQKRNDRIAAQTPKVSDGAYFPVSDELGIQSPGDTTRLFELMAALDESDPSWSHWVRAARDKEGTDVPLLIRGNHRNPGDRVPRRFLEAIDGHDVASSESLGNGSGRQWLAQRIVDPQNPLTTRVWANRIWQRLFGRGIVGTPNNFGKLGERPTHPELLDFLANELVENDWSTKSLIRQIVLSQVYQRSSSVTAAQQVNRVNLATLDPDNLLLTRQNVRRMTAEQVRDSLLAISGLLDEQMFGPSVDCFVPDHATANKPTNVPASGPLDGDGRRSIYIKVRRNFYDPFLLAFDFPDRGKSIGARTTTFVPGQALAFMNSPLVHQVADAWRIRIAATDQRFESRIETMWLQSLSRPPGSAELELMRELSDELQSPGHRGRDLWTELAHVVLNHPEFLLIR